MMALDDGSQGLRDGEVRAVLPILALVLLVGTGSAMLTTIVSLALSRAGVPASTVQAVLTAYPVGFLAGCLAARPLVARVGHERSFRVITLIAAASAIGFSLTDAMAAWLALRFAGGFAMAAMFVICESWMNLYARRHNRGRLFSLYMLATAAAVLAGQLILAAVGPAAPSAAGIAAALMVAAVLGRFATGPWPALAPPAPVENIAEPRRRYGLMQLLQAAPVTVVSVFQSGITNLNVFVLTPLYATEIGLGPSQAVALVTTVSIAGMMAQTPAGWLSDRFDRRSILLAQGVCAVLLCLAIALVGASSLPLLFVLFFLYGGIALTVYPLAIAYANARLPSRHMVAASGTLLFLYSIGNIATPGIASGLMERTAPAAMLVVLGAGGLLVALAAAANIAMREAAPGPAEPEPGETGPSA